MPVEAQLTVVDTHPVPFEHGGKNTAAVVAATHNFTGVASVARRLFQRVHAIGSGIALTHELTLIKLSDQGIAVMDDKIDSVTDIANTENRSQAMGSVHEEYDTAPGDKRGPRIFIIWISKRCALFSWPLIREIQ